VGRAAQAEEVGHLFPNEVAGVLDFLGTSNIWLVGDEAIKITREIPCSTPRELRQQGAQIDNSAHRRTGKSARRWERAGAGAGDQTVGCG
jgi:hypothetical protein